MKKNSPLLISVAIAAVYFSLVGNLQAVPPAPPAVPDAGSTGVMLGIALSGISFLKWKLKN